MGFAFSPSMWFTCRFCSQLFPDIAKLKKHKVEAHLGICLKIKCIIFEEKCLDYEWPQFTDRVYLENPSNRQNKFTNPYVSLQRLSVQELSDLLHNKPGPSHCLPSINHRIREKKRTLDTSESFPVEDDDEHSAQIDFKEEVEDMEATGPADDFGTLGSHSRSFRNCGDEVYEESQELESSDFIVASIVQGSDGSGNIQFVSTHLPATETECVLLAQSRTSGINVATVENISVDVERAEVGAENTDVDCENTEGNAQNVEVDVRNVEVRVRNVEVNPKNIEVGAENIEIGAKNIIEVDADHIETEAENIDVDAQNPKFDELATNVSDKSSPELNTANKNNTEVCSLPDTNSDSSCDAIEIEIDSESDAFEVIEIGDESETDEPKIVSFGSGKKQATTASNSVKEIENPVTVPESVSPNETHCTSSESNKSELSIAVNSKEKKQSHPDVSLNEWLKHQKEINPTNFIVLRPDPLTVKNFEPVSDANPVACKLCLEEFTDDSILRIHVNMCWFINKTLHQYCPLCNKTFAETSHLQKHISFTHSKDSTNTFNCNKCSKICVGQDTLKAHQASHVKPKPPAVKCKFCDKLLVNQRRLEDHERIHTGDRPFKCPMANCSQSFVSKSTRAVHRRVKHGKELGLTQFLCPSCGKTFPMKFILNSHIRHCHTEEKDKPFKCTHEGCNRGFMVKSRLTEHIRVHLNEKPFQCEECGRAFIGQRSLRLHLRKHNNEKDKVVSTSKIQCKLCLKTFARQRYLQIHLKLHNKVVLKRRKKPKFKCQFCGKAFLSKSNLKNHEETHLEEEDEETEDSENSE